MPATITAPPCPAWCALTTGHDDGCDIDGSRFIRHRVVVGDVEIEQPVVVEPDGAVDVEALVVWVDGHAYDFATASHLAVDLAAALITASVCSCECMTCALGQHCGACRTGRGRS